MRSRRQLRRPCSAGIPASWRARYGDELEALLEDTYGDRRPARRRTRLSLMRTGTVERLRGAGWAGGGGAHGRLRSGSLMVLAAWAMVVVGRIGVRQDRRALGRSDPAGRPVTSRGRLCRGPWAALAGAAAVVLAASLLSSLVRIPPEQPGVGPDPPSDGAGGRRHLFTGMIGRGHGGVGPPPRRAPAERVLLAVQPWSPSSRGPGSGLAGLMGRRRRGHRGRVADSRPGAAGVRSAVGAGGHPVHRRRTRGAVTWWSERGRPRPERPRRRTGPRSAAGTPVPAPLAAASLLMVLGLVVAVYGAGRAVRSMPGLVRP